MLCSIYHYPELIEAIMSLSPIRPPILIHHAATLEGGPAAPNSLEAIRDCMIAGANFIEVDVMALADTDYLLVHDSMLDTATTGHGPVSACTGIQAKRLFFKDAPEFRVPKLSEVVELFLDYGGETCLQIDFKQWRPFTSDEPLHRLLDIIQPISNRVIVSSRADWQLRKLRSYAAWVDLGFDISFYLDWHTKTPKTERYPQKLGAYGYWDDHPIAAEQVWPAADYLADRCATFLDLVPEVSTFFVNHQLLLQSLDDGFNWAEALHEQDILLAAWTVDATQRGSSIKIRKLLEAGVDQFTTNTAHSFTELLHMGW
jgi:glycerophosphoryl diester phosphodiesterase